MLQRPLAASSRLCLAGAILLLAVSQASARPDTRSMTCQQVQTLIEQSGAVVLNTGPHTYDRFVRRSGTSCALGQRVKPSSAPTRDGRCRVYVCEEFEVSPF